jgi:uncharacterized integral membrane protein
MAFPNRRRQPSLVRNLWVYRRLIGVAVVLGLMLWFVVINNTEVTVFFPFRLGKITSTAGLIILLGALVGSILTAITMTLLYAIHRSSAKAHASEAGDRVDLSDDRPPTDYAAKTKEGFSDAHWNTR